MKSTVPETQIARLGVQQIDVGELSVGPISIGTLALSGGRTEVATGSAQLIGLRVTVSLAMSLDWRVTVKIPLVDDWTWDGTLDLGTKSVSVDLGDVECPGLQSLSIDLGNLTVEDLSATLGAIGGLRLGPLVAEQVAARGVVLPVPDFQITGLRLGRLQVAGATLPAGSIASATIERASGRALPGSAVVLPGLALPDAAVGAISSEALDVDATSNVISLGADLGVLDVTLNLTPGVRTQMEELRLSDIRVRGSVDSIELRDVELPYELLDITLSQVGIESISVPTIEVS